MGLGHHPQRLAHVRRRRTKQATGNPGKSVFPVLIGAGVPARATGQDEKQNQEVREYALYYLAELQDKRSIGPIIDGSYIYSRYRGDDFMDFLLLMTGENFGRSDIKWKKWWETNKKSITLE